MICTARWQKQHVGGASPSGASACCARRGVFLGPSGRAALVIRPGGQAIDARRRDLQGLLEVVQSAHSRRAVLGKATERLMQSSWSFTYNSTPSRATRSRCETDLVLRGITVGEAARRSPTGRGAERLRICASWLRTKSAFAARHPRNPPTRAGGQTPRRGIYRSIPVRIAEASAAGGACKSRRPWSGCCGTTQTDRPLLRPAFRGVRGHSPLRGRQRTDGQAHRKPRARRRAIRLSISLPTRPVPRGVRCLPLCPTRARCCTCSLGIERRLTHYLEIVAV